MTRSLGCGYFRPHRARRQGLIVISSRKKTRVESTRHSQFRLRRRKTMRLIRLKNSKSLIAVTLAAFSLFSFAAMASAREEKPVITPAQIEKRNEERCSERTVRG